MAAGVAMAAEGAEAPSGVGAAAAAEQPLPDPPAPGPPAASPLIEVLRAPLLPGAGPGAEAPLPEPPPAPPAPVALEGAAPRAVAESGAQRAGAARAPATPDDLPAGVERRPGGYRLRIAADAATEEGGAAPLDPAAARAAEAIGRRLAAEGVAREAGRIAVVAQVATAPGTEVSVQRRLALARALAVKRALVAGGVDPTRIDLRPLGRTEEGVDAVDILPPPAPRREAAGGAVTR
ncbi:hypothetical protein [Caldovatus aquaticus]|nr:hypothetical protein [Caldovatus aquaticus]